jgi:hypothetical protein
MNKHKSQKDNESNRVAQPTLMGRWIKLSTAERALMIAILGVCGTLIGVILAGMIEIIPPLLAGDLSIERKELRLADFRFEDWRSGQLFGVPGELITGQLETDGEFESISEALNVNGYHILYKTGDFTAINTQLADGKELPGSTWTAEQPFPVVRTEFELWNISKNDPIVIDKITLHLNQYHPANPSGVVIYYLAGPEMGGIELPEHDFSATLSQNSGEVVLLRKDSTRMIVNPGEALLLRLEIGFEDSGRYDLDILIDYHFPDGSSGTIEKTGLTYGWYGMDFVDGNDVTVLK